MSLATNVTNLATRVATEVKSLRTLINGNAADLSALDTTAKSNLVVAINEVVGAAASGAGIDDGATATTSTWSSSKTSAELATKQASDADLTTIAGLTATTDNFLQAKSSAWASRTPAQVKTDLAINNVDNTSDANKPVSTATSTALAGKQPLDSDLTTIAGLTATTDNIIQAKASAWTSRTPAQFKTDLALAKGDVGLGNVDNTADTAKPVSTAQQTALDGKANTSHNHTTSNITDFATAVDARIETIVDADGAASALNTLAELSAALGADANYAATTTASLGNRVRVDASQSFNGTQQTQGRDNIAAAAASDLSTLVTNVGDTTTNFVTTFEAGLV